jgi:glutathione S-transferase
MGLAGARNGRRTAVPRRSAFSVADITGAVVAWLGGAFGMAVPADLKNVNRWLERVQGRQSWQA